MQIKVIFKNSTWVLIPCADIERATKAITDAEGAMNARRSVRLGDVFVGAHEDIAAVYVVADTAAPSS